MKQVFSWVLLSLALLLVPPARAQAQMQAPERVRIGLLAGPQINLGRLHDVTAISYEHNREFGAAGGLLIDIPFGRWAVQPGFLYSSKGFSGTVIYQSRYIDGRGRVDDKVDIAHDWNWLEIPLNVVFTTKRTRGWQLLAGPYIALLLNGRQRATLTEWENPPYYNYNQRTELTGPLKATNDVQPDDLRGSAVNFLRPRDAGVQLGGGYCFGRFGLRFSSSWGLRNLVPKQFGEASGDKLRSHSLQFGAFCMFGSR